MFNSIRWRLVASYVLLTVLTVSVLGVLALSFVDSYATQQELASLTANAEAVARQAGPLVRAGSGASPVVFATWPAPLPSWQRPGADSGHPSAGSNGLRATDGD